jgi:hypothetical protein
MVSVRGTDCVYSDDWIVLFATENIRESLGGKKRTEICIELTFRSTPPTPLLPALTLSEGE